MAQKTGGSAFGTNVKNWDKALEDMDMDMDPGGAPMVRLGDASISAPFTCRTTSVKCVVDLIRQGRCTLLSTVQQQQIMMVECMITAFTLAALIKRIPQFRDSNDGDKLPFVSRQHCI